MLLAVSRHVQAVFPLHVRGGALYLRPWKMQQLLTKLIHTVRVNKASAWRNQRPNFGNIESFLFSPIFLVPPYSLRSSKQITSAWPRSDTVSILFLINLAHWQSLLNNKACPFFQRGDIFISVRRSDLGFTPDLDFSFAWAVQTLGSWGST